MVALVVLMILTACGVVDLGGTEAGGGQAAEAPPLASKVLAAPKPPETPKPPKAEAPPRRPNVMVIETDDMRWDDLRWMPNARRLLQRRGLTFENSFAPYPLCCPSRASFLTGRYSHNHDVYSHLDPYGFGSFRDRRTLATVLQRAGYSTALVGKYLNGYGQQPVRDTGESSLRYVPPGWSQWYAGSGGGTYDYFNLTQNINGELGTAPGRYSTAVLADQTRALVRTFGRAEKPWFLWWTPVAPHHGTPREADDPGRTVRTDGHGTDWVTPARPEWVKGRFHSQIRHGAGTPPLFSAEADVSDKPRYLRRLPELTGSERAALTTVTRQRAESLFVLDVHIGRTIATLRRTGQLASTLLVFTSDNGYYLGEHRKRQGKINLHEPSLRVPLIIAGPGVPRGRRYDPVTTVDLAPTIASYAGTRMRRPDGVDLGPLIQDGDRGWGRPVVTEGMMPETGYADSQEFGPSPLNTRGLRLGRWKLTRYSTGEAELYDLAADPLELRNLARRPAHRRTLREMTQLWQRYADCRGKECSAAVPVEYRVSAEESRRITERQQRVTNRYYGN